MLYKDELCHYFLKGYIHVSRKDYLFFNNLSKRLDSFLTSNQTVLFDKLVNKYKRQLQKEKLDVEFLLSLKWKVEVKESSSEYLDANLFIEDNKIYIKAPYNVNFINNVVKTVRGLELVWDRNLKRYQTDFSTFNLKLALYYITKYYDKVKYSDNLETLFANLEKDLDKIWEPTLVCVKGKFYISCINDNLNAALGKIELNTSISTLKKLGQLGIKIHKDIELNAQQKFSAEFKTHLDTNYISEVAKWLQDLNIKLVLTPREVLYTKSIITSLKTELDKVSIKYQNAHNVSIDDLDRNSTVLIQYHRQHTLIPYHNICKVITLMNSTPVFIK